MHEIGYQLSYQLSDIIILLTTRAMADAITTVRIAESALLQTNPPASCWMD